MNIVYRKLLTSILKHTIVITLALILCVLIIRSSKFFYLVSSSFATFNEIAMLMLYLSVDFIALVLPIALALATCFDVYRFKISNQMIVMQSFGVPGSATQKPILVVGAIGTCVLWFFTTYLSPISLQKFRVLELRLVNNISLPRHSGNLLNYKGISVYAEEYKGNLNFSGLTISDNRRHDVTRLYTADIGALVNNMLYLQHGRVVEYNKTKKQISSAKFEKHIYNLKELIDKIILKFTAHELSTVDLVERNNVDLNNEYIAELHNRIISPILVLLMALVALLCSSYKNDLRKNGVAVVWISLIVILTIEAISLLLSNISMKSTIFIPVHYSFIIGSILVSLISINRLL